MTERLLVVVVLAGTVGALSWWWRRESTRDAAAGPDDQPVLPPDLRSDAPVTWVVLSTPACASCHAVRELLVAERPDETVRLVDVTARSELADRYALRRAPTTLRADSQGVVTHRLVGVEAVRDLLLRDPSSKSRQPN